MQSDSAQKMGQRWLQEIKSWRESIGTSCLNQPNLEISETKKTPQISKTPREYASQKKLVWRKETELLPRLGHSNDHAKGRQSTGDNVQTPSLRQVTEQLHQPSDCPQKDWLNHKKKALLEVQKKIVVLFLCRLRLLRAEACSRIRGRALTNDQSHFSAKTQNPKFC